MSTVTEKLEEQSEPHEKKYPGVSELATLAACLLGPRVLAERDRTVGEMEKDCAVAALCALELWRAAERRIAREKDYDAELHKRYSDYRAEQPDYAALYGRIYAPGKEFPKNDETWSFGKVATKLIPPGIQNAPEYLRALLIKNGLPIVDNVDRRIFVKYAFEVEKELANNETQLRREKMKKVRAVGVEKNRQKKNAGTEAKNSTKPRRQKTDC